MAAENFFKDLVFEAAKAQIRFGQEVTGTASGVEDFQRGDFIMEGEQIFFTVARGGLEV